jgi:hypothetical protein
MIEGVEEEQEEQEASQPTAAPPAATRPVHAPHRHLLRLHYQLLLYCSPSKEKKKKKTRENGNAGEEKYKLHLEATTGRWC